MKKLLEISLGIVTNVGGFLEMGSLSTAAQGGAAFRFQLAWPIVVGTVCIVFLTEMSGRFAAVSSHTIADGIRDRFGIKFFLFPFVTTLIVNALVLSAEIGGVSVSLELASGVRHEWWALPVAVLAWFVLWRSTFGLIEKGMSLLGLVNRIPGSRVRRLGVDIEVDLDARDTPLGNWQRWLREHVVERIPGSR
ncbi:divalent metal cation transporter [Paraburkholderia youngii]|uniref:divalent metal cation transporter n=1 Tax=Paraburkholderia youngii TaxID=2782701 RepID=UPI003D25B958